MLGKKQLTIPLRLVINPAEIFFLSSFISACSHLSNIISFKKSKIKDYCHFIVVVWALKLRVLGFNHTDFRDLSSSLSSQLLDLLSPKKGLCGYFIKPEFFDAVDNVDLCKMNMHSVPDQADST